MQELIIKMLKHPVAIILLITVTLHALLILTAAILQKTRNKTKIKEMNTALRESEQRIQKLFYEMEKNKIELTESLTRMNSLFSGQFIDKNPQNQKPNK